jgi:hypothetical protein
MLRRLVLIAVVAGAFVPGVSAQTTGTPVFLAPTKAFRSSEIGLFFTDPGDGFTLEGMYRMGRGAADIGFRAGIGDNDVNTPNGPSSTFFLAGVDFRFRVVKATDAFPLEGSMTLGVGGVFGDGVTVGLVPIGISLGRRINLEGTKTTFIPYFHPVLVPVFGDDNDDAVRFGIGLGVDIQFSPRLDARLGAGLGDYDGISLGVSFTH